MAADVYKFNPFTRRLDNTGGGGGGGGIYTAGQGLALTANQFSIPNNGVTDAMIASASKWNAASSSTSVTVAQLQTLIGAGNVAVNSTYLITNPQNGGQIIVKGETVNSVSFAGTWLRQTKITGFGWVRLTGGASGSVDTLTVNGVNQMTASVAYNTSLTNTATLVAANINANGAATFIAVAILDTIALFQKTASTTDNGSVVTATATTITIGNTQNITNGQTPITQQLFVTYDIAADRVRSCVDIVLNNKMFISEVYRASLTFDPFAEFRWGESVFSGNTFDDAYCRNTVAISNNLIIENTINTRGRFDGNLITTGGLSYNVVRSQISSNLFFAGICRTNVLMNAFVSSGGITGNIMLSTGNIINGAFVSGFSDGFISGNTFSGVSANIWQVSIFGKSASISNNILGSQSATIRNAVLNGESSTISGNTITSANANSGIRQCILNGISSNISNNNFAAAANTGGVISCILNGASSNISSNVFSAGTNSSIQFCNLNASGAAIGGYTFDTTMTVITGIEWGADDTISMKLASPVFTGAANLGLSGSPIPVGILPVAKGYTLTSVFEGNGLVGASAMIQVALEVDTTVSVTPAMTIAEANDINFINGATSNKSVAANRKIQATPTGANITAGSFQLFVQFKISKY